MLRGHATGRGEQAGKERLGPMKFCSAGDRIDLERGQVAQQRLMVFEVGDEGEKAIAGRVAVAERGDRMVRAWFRTAQQKRKRFIPNVSSTVGCVVIRFDKHANRSFIDGGISTASLA
jgi:hypothetical protein